MKSKKVEKPVEIKEKATQPVATKKADKKVNKKIMENHKKAAAHHMEAAKHHLEAAKDQEAGNYEKAAYNIVLAHGHHTIAGEFLNDDAKYHAQTLKRTNYR